MYIQVHGVLKWYLHVFTLCEHVQTVYIHVYGFSYLLLTCYNMSIPCIYRPEDIHCCCIAAALLLHLWFIDRLDPSAHFDWAGF